MQGEKQITTFEFPKLHLVIHVRMSVSLTRRPVVPVWEMVLVRNIVHHR